MHKFRLIVQNPGKFKNIPTQKKLKLWIETALEMIPNIPNHAKPSLTIRFIEKEESAQLNESYRHKQGPTNILSFQDENIPGFPSTSYGELALCVPLIQEEALTQNKTVEAHFAHLVLHGLLHLLGYDHIEPNEATQMEECEIMILERLGYRNPYE